MKLALKWVATLLLMLVLLSLEYLNTKLYYRPGFVRVADTLVNEEVLQQLHFLKMALRNGAGVQMQRYYPEGFVFINALYGLSWSETLKNINKNSALYKEGISEQNWAIGQVYSATGKRVFDRSLPLAYGAFYSGWSGILLARKLTLQPGTQRDPQDVTTFSATCKRIAEALQGSPTPFLESYRGMAWPADMVMCIACLASYDQLFNTHQYQPLIADWLIKVEERIDPQTGLIPHQTDVETGQAIEGPRGSSQALMGCFLNGIDPVFANDQFNRFKTHFVDSRFGLPGIREYPKGVNGEEDIDSGPVLLQIGGAASIVGVKTMAMHQEWTTGEGLRNSIEGFGFPVKNEGGKKYLFGQLPLVDAFIAWTNASYPDPTNYQQAESWRGRFQLYSGMLALCILFLSWLWWKPYMRR
jgi:hypothetical protein